MRTLYVGLGENANENNLVGRVDKESIRDYGLDPNCFEDESCTYLSVPYTSSAVSSLSIALADCILKNYETKIIYNSLSKSYSFLSDSEKHKIMEDIHQNKANKDLVNALMFQQRRLKVAEEITEYFEIDDQLDLDGFVNFRLREYRKELDYLIEDRVEKYMIEKEYNEFIHLLKCFVDSRPSKTTKLHVVFYPSNLYTLLDTNLRPVELNKSHLHENTIIQQPSDTLAGILVETLPKKIILHNVGLYCKTELLDTLKKVFSYRLEICNGCKICLQ